MNRLLASAATIAIAATLSAAASAQSFNNGSFESGTLTGWTQGGGRWSGGPYPVAADYLPGGVNYNPSYIVNSVTNAGFDANTDNVLRTAYAGAHSAKVNDANQNYSVSLLSQQVNGYTDPLIAFAYAAVLQDSHGATDSDAFIITLTDLTTSEVLFNFNLNSYTAPGLFTQSSSGWYYSEWIEQSFDVSTRSGHDFLLTLLANDCPYGGHAGYAYLDGFGGVLGGGGTGGGTGISVYWDGSDAANANNSIVDGGNGTWNLVDTTFTDVTGATNNAYPTTPPTVIFAGAPGTVTVDGDGGQIQASGLDFIVDGYHIVGDSIELVDGSTVTPPAGDGGVSLLAVSTGSAIVSVGDGTAAGAAFVATIDSDLFGSVDLVKRGLGTLALNGNNSFANLVIDEGTAAIGTNNSAGAGTITIASDATLAAGAQGVVLANDVVTLGNGLVNAGPMGNVFTLNGPISGPGSISQIGAGNLVLNGANSYNNLGINQGTVTFGSNTAGGIGNIAINDNATLAAGVSGLVVANDIQTTGNGFVNSGSGVFTLAGVISYPGSITKTGTGTLIYTNANSYSGPTTVAQGKLLVNGSANNSFVTVNSGATLGGNGSVGSVSVLNGGNIAPGASIGTLTVNGNYNQASGSIYQVELTSAGQSDRINVTGAATLAAGAIVNVTKLDAARYVLGTRYTILNAGLGRTGTYTLTGNTAVSTFINVVGTYDANNAYLNVLQTRAFAAAGATPNQIAAARGADSVGNGALFTAIAYLPTDAAAQHALDQVSGELHASLRGAAFEDSRFVREAVIGHLRSSGTDLRTGMWFQGFGSWGNIDSDGNAAKVKRDIGGFFIGTDVVNTESVTAGFVGGYATADVTIPDRGSRATTDDWSIGAYFDYTASGFGLRAGVDQKWRNIKANRFVTFPGFSDGVTSRYQHQVLQLYGDVGYAIKFGSAELEPFGQLAWVQVKGDAFTEKGGAATLSSLGRSDDYWVSTVGGRVGFGSPAFGVSALAGWRRTWGGDLDTPLVMRLAAGPAFEIAGPGIARDVAALALKMTARVGPDVDISLGYSGQTGGGLNDHGGKATLSFRF